MPRVIDADQLDGATRVERGYEPPSPPPKPVSKGDETLKLLATLIERLPQMIAAGTKAPVVMMEAAKAPDVKITSPVYVSPSEVNVPQAPAVNIPEGKAPIVNVEPPNVHLTIKRPDEWEFTIKRNEYGQMETIRAKAI